MRPFEDPAISAAFDALPQDTRTGVLKLRELIFETAQELPKALPLQEALRWGQPAYLAPKGSTIRLGGHKSARFALFVHCQSRLMCEFTSAFPGEDRIDGNRAILFDSPDQIDETRHGWLIARALTYHL
ncbi:DUF1801 domain-containing protein [Roseibium sp. RKSG952]|uniref:DUF1801 domain-containing protein n=1 Tax=Roseibium sp. RKSG952 TaxID=2529384 RepID=UPI0012BD2959|nr:DUF1801 domain-containing protein [Roseibium sp. RKSG952]MTI01005.1 DUF1801 domain-containing protein [Roseibium sp. RKSG952]